MNQSLLRLTVFGLTSIVVLGQTTTPAPPTLSELKLVRWIRLQYVEFGLGRNMAARLIALLPSAIFDTPVAIRFLAGPNAATDLAQPESLDWVRQ
jgi:hypothetical protein